MGQISPATANIIVLAVALGLYGLVWWGSRNMSRFAKVLARLSPVGFVIPVLLYVAAWTAGYGAKEAANIPVRELIVPAVADTPAEVPAKEIEADPKPAEPPEGERSQ